MAGNDQYFNKIKNSNKGGPGSKINTNFTRDRGDSEDQHQYNQSSANTGVKRTLEQARADLERPYYENDNASSKRQKLSQNNDYRQTAA